MDIALRMSMFTSIYMTFFVLFFATDNSVKKQREKYIESIKNQEDEVVDESQIEAEIEELNKRFQEEDSARTLVIIRYVFRIFWILLLINIIMPLSFDFWDALTANPTLGRTYQLLTLLSFIFIIVSFLVDIIPLFKLFSIKKQISEDGHGLFKFTYFSQQLKQMKFVRFFTLFLSVSSVLLLISSQIILWGIIVW